MRSAILLGLLSASLFGQAYVQTPSANHESLEYLLNSKPAVQVSSLDASGNCTAGKDRWINTATGKEWICTAANTWWRVVIADSLDNISLGTPLAPASGGVGTNINVPPHLRFLGDGSDGAITCSGNIAGVKYATTFTVANGATCTLNVISQPLVVHATGVCTIAGTINGSGTAAGSYVTGDAGGSGGGGGGGAAAGAVGSTSGMIGMTLLGYQLLSGGAIGSSSGGTGGAGNATSTVVQRYMFDYASGLYHGGAKGGTGGSSGGSGGNGGQTVILICQSINFTGTIDVSGAVGVNSTGNSVGSGGGGGGGYAWLIGRDSVINSGTITVTGGAGGTCGAYTTCGAGGVGGAGWSKVAQMQ